MLVFFPSFQFFFLTYINIYLIIKNLFKLLLELRTNSKFSFKKAEYKIDIFLSVLVRRLQITIMIHG